MDVARLPAPNRRRIEASGKLPSYPSGQVSQGEIENESAIPSFKRISGPKQRKLYAASAPLSLHSLSEGKVQVDGFAPLPESGGRPAARPF